MKEPVSLTIDVEKPRKDALEALAQERGASVASLVREAIDRFLKRRGEG